MVEFKDSRVWMKSRHKDTRTTRAVTLKLSVQRPPLTLTPLPPAMTNSNTEPYVQSGEPLHEFLRSFWQRQVDQAEEEVPDYRHPPLPLARIKKVMKSDPDVKVHTFEPRTSFKLSVV